MAEIRSKMEAEHKNFRNCGTGYDEALKLEKVLQMLMPPPARQLPGTKRGAETKDGVIMDGELAREVSPRPFGSGAVALFICLFALLCIRKAKQDENGQPGYGFSKLVDLALKFGASSVFLRGVSAEHARIVSERLLRSLEQPNSENIAALLEGLPEAMQLHSNIARELAGETLFTAFTDRVPKCPDKRTERNGQRREVSRSLKRLLQKIKS